MTGHQIDELICKAESLLEKTTTNRSVTFKNKLLCVAIELGNNLENAVCKGQASYMEDLKKELKKELETA